MTATKGTDFDEYYLKENLMMGLVEKGFDKPSPVQEECIPLILAGILVLFPFSFLVGPSFSFF